MLYFYVFLRFFYVFYKIQNSWLFSFLPCFIRFLELWQHRKKHSRDLWTRWVLYRASMGWRSTQRKPKCWWPQPQQLQLKSHATTFRTRDDHENGIPIPVGNPMGIPWDWEFMTQLGTLVWSVAMSVAMYGCESRTINAADRNRMMRISWTEHRTKNSILEELESSCRLLAEVKRRKLQYLGHVVRADNLCTHVLHGIVAGKRRRGRPRRRWTDDIKQWTGIPVAECIQHAKDRSAWRALVSVSVTSDSQSHEDGPRQGKVEYPNIQLSEFPEQVHMCLSPFLYRLC